MSGRSWQGIRARAGAVAAAVLALVLVSAGPGVGAGPASAKTGVVPTAYLYVPTDGGRLVVRWDGKAAGYTLAKARAILPGRFDGVGGGVFVYRAGSAPDGVLRVRQSGDGIALSFKKESVNGHFEPLTGDFDGNGLTDILWHQPQGDPSYLWLFHADGSHTSKVFPITTDPGYPWAVRTADVNLDGITDLIRKGDREVWVMKADGTHTVRNVALPLTPAADSLIVGNVGPDDGVSRRRAVAVYEGGLERLVTFNAAGQSTSRQLRAHTGTCCTNQPAFSGHFRAGYAETLFFANGTGAGTEHLQDITAGGNILTSPAPQITVAYTTTVGDFDGNGYDDVLLSNRSGATFLLSSDGTSFTKTDPADIPARSVVYAVPMAPT